MSFIVSVAVLSAVVGVSCALPGMVLVLRRQAMLSDALSHAVLPGIALAALITGSPTSGWLIVGAALGGVLVLALTEWIRSKHLVTNDSATGLVFPTFFALGIILITLKLARMPLSEHTVLVGDLNISALDHLIIGTWDLGPKEAWTIGSVGLLTAVVIFIFHRHLQVSAFDPVFAQAIGLRVKLVEYLIMCLVAINVVVAFHAAGAVLVVALMVVPAAAAALIATTVTQMVILTLLVAVISSQLGFWGAYHLDAATSPMMALIAGLVFLVLYLLRGILVRVRTR